MNHYGLMLILKQVSHSDQYFMVQFTLYRYCCSPMIKVTDLECFILIAFKLKFGVESLLSEGVALAGGIREPCSLALV